MRVWRWGRRCGCCRRCGCRGRGSGYAADVVLDGRANKGDVIDGDIVYKRRFDLRAQRCEVRSTSIVPSDLHGEERSRKVRNTSLIPTDDRSTQTRTREINRGEGANLALHSGPIDSYTADLVQRSRIDHAAELTSLSITLIVVVIIYPVFTEGVCAGDICKWSNNEGNSEAYICARPQMKGLILDTNTVRKNCIIYRAGIKKCCMSVGIGLGFYKRRRGIHGYHMVSRPSTEQILLFHTFGTR